MNKVVFCVAGFLAVSLVTSDADAQRMEGQRGFSGDSPAFKMMAALDADRDGRLSASELENAVIALTKLDINKDGKLSGKEIGWPPSREIESRKGRRSGRPSGRSFFGFGESQSPKRPNYERYKGSSKSQRSQK